MKFTFAPGDASRAQLLMLPVFEGELGPKGKKPRALDVVDGRYTGDLQKPPLVGEARAAWLRQYAAAHKANLQQSYAYADSHTDLPLLRAVGNPVAVNPDVALFRVAKKRRWPVEEWHAMKGTPKVMLPEPAR